SNIILLEISHAVHFPSSDEEREGRHRHRVHAHRLADRRRRHRRDGQRRHEGEQRAQQRREHDAVSEPSRFETGRPGSGPPISFGASGDKPYERYRQPMLLRYSSLALLICLAAITLLIELPSP